MNVECSSGLLGAEIGQMLQVGFRGLAVTDADPIILDIAERNLGGVILFDQEMANPEISRSRREESQTGFRNIQSPAQVRALVASLQKHASTPLLIAIDQEGGRVNRLKPDYGFPPTVSQQELGAMKFPTTTFEQSQNIARTLSELGVNFNLAPVVDLDFPDNPIIHGKQRSFGRNPQAVSAHALEFIKAHRQAGVLTCLKHFPGHGSARADTHLGLVDVTACWTEDELIPFQAMIKSGYADAVMCAHLFNACLDPDHPASLSHATLTGLLRKELGFDGVIVSDDMEMKAITSRYGLETAINLAINAGVDLLCFGNNLNFDPHIGEKAARIISHLVAAGSISLSRIHESFQRIQRLKAGLQRA